MGVKKNPKIIISASGMAEGGRILRHLMEYLPDERNTVLFIGYQVPGTRGARLLNGEKEIKILGENIPVKARISFLNKMSAHADYEEIIHWLKGFKKRPKGIFIIHGDPESSLHLKNEIEKQLKWNCVVPDYLQEITLT
jgi:metallo-beta-lactamase family protein